jgi:DNA primase
VSDFPRLSASQKSSLEAACQKYEEAFRGSPAEEYLEGRGLPASVSAGFRLGYVAETATGHEAAKGRLALPYITPSGVIDLRFRTLGDEEPKYLSLSGATPHLFGVCQLHQAVDYVAICEGELDAVVLSGLCDVPAVAIPGVGAWKRWWRHLFSDFRVILCLDGDEAGRSAAQKIRKDLPDSTTVRMPDGYDVNGYYMEHGRETVRKLIGIDE